MGAQQCQLVNSTSNELFELPTRYLLKCLANKPEIGYFSISLLVSNEYGRSEANSQLFLVSPDERVYNFQTYAQIESVWPRVGSKAGGTLVTITGKYLYTDADVPALVEIAGRPCKVVGFDRG